MPLAYLNVTSEPSGALHRLVGVSPARHLDEPADDANDGLIFQRLNLRRGRGEHLDLSSSSAAEAVELRHPTGPRRPGQARCGDRSRAAVSAATLTCRAARAKASKPYSAQP